MTYKFEQFKIEIKNPQINVVGVNDDFNGTASVDVLLSLGSAQSKAAKFVVTLDGFTYNDEWLKDEVEAWVTNELKKYEV